MILDTHQDFIDINSLVKPQKSWINSGNGVLYTSIACILDNEPQSNYAYYLGNILRCIDDNTILQRTPDNQFGQESWDDYLGIAVACLVLKETHLPFRLIISLIHHLGFMFNGKKWSDIPKSWLARFPVVWIIMCAAMLPWFKFSFKCLLTVYFSVFKQTTNINDESGIQLQFLQLYALHYLGNSKPLIKWLQLLKLDNTSLSGIMSHYYDIGHPIVEGMKKYEL